jgi:hypothetical protein
MSSQSHHDCRARTDSTSFFLCASGMILSVLLISINLRDLHSFYLCQSELCSVGFRQHWKKFQECDFCSLVYAMEGTHHEDGYSLGRGNAVSVECQHWCQESESSMHYTSHVLWQRRPTRVSAFHTLIGSFVYMFAPCKWNFFSSRSFFAAAHCRFATSAIQKPLISATIKQQMEFFGNFLCGCIL